MRIVLVRPYYPENLKQQSFPLGLAYLASVLERENYIVKIFDLNMMGISNKEFLQYLINNPVDVIGVSGLTYDFFGMIELCNMIKEEKKLKGKPLIIGGIHVSSLPSFSLEKTKADIAVIGEGEVTMLELIKCLENNQDLKMVKGIAFFEKNTFYQTDLRPLIENLDVIPFPAWHLIKLNIYNQPHGGFFKARPFFPILTSRGCPYQCVYCASKNFWRNKIRFRSVKNVVDEIEYLIKKYGAKEIQIWDDNFTLNKNYVIAFAKEIIRRKIKIFFSCPNGVRIDTLDDELLRIMYAIGFYSLIFAVETASENIQNVIKKYLNLKIVPHIISEAKRLGYFNRAFFIIGLPKETINDVKKTLNFALKLKLDSANFFMFTPLPGSSFFNQWIKNKDLNSINWRYEFFSNPQNMEGYNKIQPTELKKLQRYIYIRFYLLRPWKIIRHILRYKLTQWDVLINRIVYVIKNFI